jgi:hypothetical protein
MGWLEIPLLRRVRGGEPRRWRRQPCALAICGSSDAASKSRFQTSAVARPRKQVRRECAQLKDTPRASFRVSTCRCKMPADQIKGTNPPLAALRSAGTHLYSSKFTRLALPEYGLLATSMASPQLGYNHLVSSFVGAQFVCACNTCKFTYRARAIIPSVKKRQQSTGYRCSPNPFGTIMQRRPSFLRTLVISLTVTQKNSACSNTWPDMTMS